MGGAKVVEAASKSERVSTVCTAIHIEDAYACYQSMATFVNTHQNEYCYSENDSLQKADQFYQILVGYHDICKNHAALLDATTHPAIAAQIMSNGGY